MKKEKILHICGFICESRLSGIDIKGGRGCFIKEREAMIPNLGSFRIAYHNERRIYCSRQRQEVKQG